MENEEIIEDDNPVTTIWETTEDTLIKKEKHEKPIEMVTSWNIKEEKEKIKKYDAVIDEWKAKRKISEDRVDMHKLKHK